MQVCYGGIKPRSNGITIDPVNYIYYFPFQKPDSAYAYYSNFYKVEWSKNDSLIRKNPYEDPGANKAHIDSCLKYQNIRFFRCFYKNIAGIVYKYVDVSVKGTMLAEASKPDMAGNDIEILRYYESGEVLSRTTFTQLFIREYHISGGTRSLLFIHLANMLDTTSRLIGDSLWYNLSPNLVKNGSDKLFYKNSNLRIERFYISGKLKDTTYTEYHNNGKLRRKYEVKDGRLDGVYQVFSKEGQINEELVYKKGELVKTNVAAKKTNNRKAFLFGNDIYAPPQNEKYANPNGSFINILSAVNDISLLDKTLMQHKGFRSENIIKISNEEATKPSVLSAFKKFIDQLNKGDIVFIHFSGHGWYHYKDEINKKIPELLLPCRDAYKASNFDSDTGIIKQPELEAFFNTAKSILGPAGQLYISIDVSHAGYLLPDESTDTSANQNESSFRGETNNLLLNLSKQPGAPTFIITGTLKDQSSWEINGNDNKIYGLYSYMLAQSLANPIIFDGYDLYENVRDSMNTRQGKKQTPGYFATKNQSLFDPDEEIQAENTVSLPAVNLSGNAFVLSVGINQYASSKSSGLRFQNAATDAGNYADYFTNQFSELNPDKAKKTTSALLLNETATKEKILAAINDAISNTKPEDYFVFNFSGYCKPLSDTGGKKITYFVPYGLKDISDDNEIKQKGISLKQLKDLLQLIPANNQLFITEAGATTDFQREFIQALIETSPTIAALSNKNRIFIVPNSSGFDNCNCKNRVWEQGPINYYITNLSDDLNIFGLFERGLYADAIRFALTKTEADCDYFRTPYFNIFFEKDFVSDLKYFLPDELMNSRGIKVVEKDRQAISSSVSNRYALIVGTDNYGGKPDWANLNNPIYDADELAGSLEKNFNYKVTLLKDAPADSIYKHILRLSSVLTSSDQLFIFIAGHGDFDERLFDDGFIVCSNSKTIRDDPYRNTYIQYSKLSRMINKLPAQQILMVLDVCFGGTFDERVARNTARSKDNYSDLGTEAFFAEKMKKKTRLYLTSGGKKEVPDGYKGKHSPFAVRLLQALDAKGGSSKILTASDLFQFVKMLPSGPMIGSFGDDEPGSEFVMLAK